MNAHSTQVKAITKQVSGKTVCPWLCNLVPADVPGPGAAQSVLHPRKDVFILKVAKIGVNGDRHSKMELELVTPKGLEKVSPYRCDTREAQCDPEPVSCVCNKPKKKKGSSTKKPYEEIGAIFNGNEIKIRIPKSTSKPPKLTPSQLKLQNQCTCEDTMSVCSETCGLPGEDGGPANRLNFQIPDDICEALTNRTALNSELVYSRQEAHDTLCNTCNVTPNDAPKGVKAQKVLHPDKDVFLLKIGKQTDEPNRTGNIEVELITPKAPAKLKPATHSCKQIQCEENDLTCCMPCRTCRGVFPKKRKLKRRN